MINTLKQKFIKETETMLGDKKVKIEKVTPRDFKALFGVVEALPSLLISVAQAPKGQEVEYLLTALDIGLDEIITVVSVLTGVDREYLTDKCGMDELIEYLVKMVEFNNLEKLSKNIKRLLPMNGEESN